MAFYQSKLAYEMDSWDVFAAVEAGENLVIVDGRSPEAFAAEHIPGAVNVPHREIGSHTPDGLDKTRIHVCYCDGIGCNASTKTALKLLTLGLEVRELIGGLDWWKRDGYATAGTRGQPGKDIQCDC